MFADLHAHYPMRVVEDLTPRSTLDELRRVKGKRSKLRAILLRLASMLASHRTPFSDYRITPTRLRDGRVCLAMSVLYRPGEELGKPSVGQRQPEDDGLAAGPEELGVEHAEDERGQRERGQAQRPWIGDRAGDELNALAARGGVSRLLEALLISTSSSPRFHEIPSSVEGVGSGGSLGQLCPTD